MSFSLKRISRSRQSFEGNLFAERCFSLGHWDTHWNTHPPELWLSGSRLGGPRPGFVRAPTSGRGRVHRRGDPSGGPHGRGAGRVLRGHSAPRRSWTKSEKPLGTDETLALGQHLPTAGVCQFTEVSLLSVLGSNPFL